MITLSEDQVAFLLAHWLDWTFIPKLLNNLTRETLERFMDEYADYEFNTEFSEDIWKNAWIYYFEHNGKLTPEIEDTIENL